MASRLKEDLNEILSTAYDKSCAEYLRLYPNDSQPFITCTYRSKGEQDSLYSIGRTVKGAKVTNAKGGESPHNYKPSPAFDIAFIKLNKKVDYTESLFKKFAEIIIKIQPLVEWGGNWTSFKDTPHYQLKDWRKYIK